MIYEYLKVGAIFPKRHCYSLLNGAFGQAPLWRHIDEALLFHHRRKKLRETQKRENIPAIVYFACDFNAICCIFVCNKSIVIIKGSTWFGHLGNHQIIGPLAQASCLFVVMFYWDTFAPFFNILVPRQKGPHFVDRTFKLIFLFENCVIWVQIPWFQSTIILQMIKLTDWHSIGDEPLSEQVIAFLGHLASMSSSYFDLLWGIFFMWPLLLTWFNFNPSMDK